MKNIVLVFDHPYTLTASNNQPHHRSFSAALAKNVIDAYQDNGDHVDVIDLHAENFDPIMHAEDLANWRKSTPMNPQVDHYQDLLSRADILVFIFPIWWGIMPAMTKGFFDKVIAKGVLYQENPKTRLMRHQFQNLSKVQILTTMAMPNWLYRTIFASPISKVIIRGTFQKMGFHHTQWFNYTNLANKSEATRIKLLNQVSHKILK